MNSDSIIEDQIDVLAQARALNDQGMFLSALPLLDRLKAHHDIEAVCEATRTMSHLGANRAADALVLQTWRRHRDNPHAILALLRNRAYRRGPYAAWKALQTVRMPADAPARLLGELASMEAYVMATLRDFDAAQHAYERALALAADEPWIHVEWAYVCERRDDLPRAFAAVDRALDLLPGYRPAIQMRATLLTMSGSADEALDLLTREFARSESASLGAQLYEQQYERGLYDEAWATLDRIEALEALQDKVAIGWRAARRTDVAMRQGRLDVAREQAALADGPFYAPIAERLAAEGLKPKVVLLPVGLVRQHWMTCAPATLTSIARYWHRSAEHLEIAEEICYDGTPNHAERRWAESQGFITREFTVDWNSARALLDAGMPFTLTTIYTGGGHLQAAIGYDLLRNSLLIRDPSLAAHTEYEATALFEAHRSTGPRGMVMVPPERAAELAAIDLPEAALWDEYHLLMAALARHDRDAAQAAAERLAALQPEHRMTLAAKRSLAMYDGDENTILAVTEALLAKYPDDSNLQLSKTASLAAIGGRAAHIEWLAHLANRPRPEAAVLTRYADRLAEDGRRLDQALTITRRALRWAPMEPLAWWQMAALLWQRNEPQGALQYYRIAACLRDTGEDYAASYFRACRYVRDIETGLHFLRDRVARFGEKSSSPACTLFEQLDMLERSEEAFAVLEAALAKRPDDGGLLIFYAEAKIRYGKPDEAQALLDRAAATSRRADWLRAQGIVVEVQGRLAEALAFAREASALDPLNLRQQRMVASLLARLEGRAAAEDWLRAVCERFPRNFGLQKLLYDWLDVNDLETCETQLRHMKNTHPGDVWVLRELSSNMVRRQRFEEGWHFAKAALARGAEQSYTHTTLAYVALHQTGYEAAVPYLKQAIALEVDNDYAINTLINEAPTLAQRREALDFVWAELLRQVTVGDGLLTFQSAARAVMPEEELLETLRFALQERPDLWHAWLALVVQLCDMGRSDEALALTGDAIQRFPMLPTLFLHQARAHILQGDRETARASLQRALSITPGWGRAVRMYVDTVVDEGTGLDRAEAVVRNALLRQTDNADLRGLLGWLLERQQRNDEALVEVLASLKQDPDQPWVWDMARRLFEQQGKPEQIDAMIADVVQARPGDPSVWIISAQQTPDVDKALQATERAIALDARRIGAWQTRLDILLKAKRFDELDALLAALPWGEHAPVRLKAFAPRVLRERGKVQEAIEAMRGLLAIEPNEYELWRELADWLDADDMHTEYLAAARELVRIAPNHAYAYGYLGHALLKNGQGADAIPHFKRALALDPAYVFGATNLFDLAIDVPDLDTAAWALDCVAPHYQRAFLAGRRMVLHCRQEDRDAAQAAFAEVLRLAGGDSQAVTYAVDVMKKEGWRDAAMTAVIAAIRAGQCAPAGVRFLLTELATEYGAGQIYRKIDYLLPDDKGHALKRELLSWCADEGRTGPALALIKGYRHVLQADDMCWGQGGRVFLVERDWQGAIDWQADWRTRPGTPAWALDNLANAYFNMGRRSEGFEVIRKASQLDPDDHDIRLWLAAEAAFAGDTERLARLLASIDDERLMRYMRPVRRLLGSYLAAVQAGNSKAAVEGFGIVEPSTKTNVALRHLMRDLGRKLLREYTRWWLKPLRFVQLSCL